MLARIHCIGRDIECGARQCGPDTTLWECQNSSWDYAKALDLLKKNPPEQRIDIHLPYSLYLRLEESWSRFKAEASILENQKY
ncbi:hypothetical protein V1515DRAFT_609099 [Lipomyces mesembrius]